MSAPILLAFDGAEATGKTTVAQAFHKRVPSSIVSPEFSVDEIGQFLASAVTRSPHHILPSALAQSLLFLADYATNVDHAISSPASVVILDRGHLSKYAYQFQVLSSVLSHDRADEILNSVLAAVPRPRRSYLLIATPDVIRHRLRDLRHEDVDGIRLAFIESSQKIMVERASVESDCLTIDTSSLDVAQVVDLILADIDSFGCT